MLAENVATMATVQTIVCLPMEQQERAFSLYSAKCESHMYEWWEWSLMVNYFIGLAIATLLELVLYVPYSFSTTCVKRSVHGKVSPLVHYYLPGTWSPGGSSIYARSSVRKGLGTKLLIHQPLCSVAILSILALGRLLAGNLMYTNVVQQLSSHPLMATYSEDGELCTN